MLDLCHRFGRASTNENQEFLRPRNPRGILRAILVGKIMIKLLGIIRSLLWISLFSDSQMMISAELAFKRQRWYIKPIKCRLNEPK
jgi:hypothetical protein